MFRALPAAALALPLLLTPLAARADEAAPAAAPAATPAPYTDGDLALAESDILTRKLGAADLLAAQHEAQLGVLGRQLAGLQRQLAAEKTAHAQLKSWVDGWFAAPSAQQ